MKNKIKLLRIFFRESNFTQHDENTFHYFFHQISLLLNVEISKHHDKVLDTLLITFGTKDLWLKYYKEDEIPDYHWYKKTGSASVIFDYEKFYKLEIEDRKKMVFLAACEAIYKMAEKGKQIELMEALFKISEKYKNIKYLDTKYSCLEKSFESEGKNIKCSVVFEFNDNISINLIILNVESKIENKFLITEFDYGFIEWLITAFKNIEIQNGILTLKGSKELEYLPYKIDISSFF